MVPYPPKAVVVVSVKGCIQLTDQAPRPSHQTEILAVVADQGLSLQIVRTLQEDGYAVREAGSASAAIAAVEAGVPDLMLVALSGPEVGSLLNTLQGHPVRGTMALLAVAPASETAALLESGADDVLSTPLNLQAARYAVQSVLRLKLAERTTRSLISQKAREQQILHRAGQRLAAARSLIDVLTVTAEVIRANLGFDRVNIALFDSNAASLRSIVSTDAQGRVYNVPEYPMTVSMAAGSPFLELPAYQALFVHDLESYYIPDTKGKAPSYFRPFLDGPVRETLLVVLRANDRIEGLLTVDNLYSGRTFGPEEAGTLITLARQAALAIERARVAEELEARASEAEALARAGAMLSSVLEPAAVHEIVLEQVATLIQYDHALMLICDGTWARFVAGRGAEALHPGTPVIDLEGSGGAALQALDGMALRITDTAASPVWHDFPLWAGEHRIRSAIIAPLMSDGVMLACLCLASFTSNAFTARQTDLTFRFADRATQALRNARLYRAALDRANEATDALWVNDPIAADSDEQSVADMTADQAEPTSIESIAVDEVASAERQEQVIDNLRLLSLLDAGGLSVNPQPVTVRSLVERSIKSASRVVRERNISVTGPDDLTAIVDPVRATEIIGNLLDNAVRYSDDGSHVTVAWSVEDHSAVIRVHDHGSGIPSQSRRYLFTRFGWLPGTSSRRTPKGIGVGLYLGRTIASVMGGGLELEASSAKGSLFRLWFPLPPD
ncbi:MAG: putative histidine kinase, hybrid [Chloroflexi bacterium]|nr:putative histidine kinase, hybrid [Chloroflexota bacterium]